MIKPTHKSTFWILLPVLGIITFVLLYIIAALNYPGGSAFNKQSTGFSWAHNFWCTLLNDQAINGEANPAKPIAMVAMLVLCFSLGVFWWLFPRYTGAERNYKMIIPISGILSMITGLLLFTPLDHDLIIYLPIVQKITFATILIWFCWVDISIYNKYAPMAIPTDRYD